MQVRNPSLYSNSKKSGVIQVQRPWRYSDIRKKGSSQVKYLGAIRTTGNEGHTRELTFALCESQELKVIQGQRISRLSRYWNQRNFWFKIENLARSSRPKNTKIGRGNKVSKLFFLNRFFRHFRFSNKCIIGSDEVKIFRAIRITWN